MNKKTDTNKYNFGIAPLPNLDYHFEVGNSLLGLPARYHTDNMPTTVKNLLTIIKPLKHQFFLECDHDKKDELRKQINSKIKQCYKQIQNSIIKKESVEEIDFNSAVQPNLLGGSNPTQQNLPTYYTTKKQGKVKSIDTKEQIKLDFDFKIDFNEVFYCPRWL